MTRSGQHPTLYTHTYTPLSTLLITLIHSRYIMNNGSNFEDVEDRDGQCSVEMGKKMTGADINRSSFLVECLAIQ